MKPYRIKIFCSILFSLILSTILHGQNSKKIVLTVCIDGNSKLHIKGGKMFWEHLEDVPPGKHQECTVLTKVNGKRWDDWKSAFQLDFNTDSCSFVGTKILFNEISQLVQSPTAANGWETIWWFNDPSPYPHSYSASFEFTPIKKSVVPGPIRSQSPIKKSDVSKPVKPKSTVKKDTIVSEYIPNNISFEIGNSTLTKGSLSELDKIYELLSSSSKKIEIYGHTNNVGEKIKLQKLSEDRALAVYNYLLNKGLSKERMSYHGYGDSKPIASNDTEEGKMKNRRVEIKIVE
jgi:outer membrane protein OmpA-like peptidoglycan-associated protein